MPMLARSAQGLYWMGRYLERAAHLCRLLRLQTAALADRPVGEIYAGWERIYRSLGQAPPGGSLVAYEDDDNGNGSGAASGGVSSDGALSEGAGATGGQQAQSASGDDYTLADSFALADDLTFERSNPGSVWSCFALGRENARQMRHCISGEMWTSLNRAYLRIQQVRITDIWTGSPEGFYAAISADIDTFMGVASATMYRGEGWHFMQLGRFVERAQQVAALLEAQAAAADAGREQSESDWVTLLRAYHAFEEYGRAYGIAVVPQQALDLLVTDPLLPNSLCRCLDRAEVELAALGTAAPDAGSAAAVRRLSGRLRALAHYEWPDAEAGARAGLLRRLGEHCRELHNLITATYFEYPVSHLPRP